MKYTYAVLGKKYTKEEWLRFERKLGRTVLESVPRTSSLKKAESKASEFRAGTKHKVYYDPARPQNSTLKPGDIHYSTTFWYEVVFLFAFIGGCSLACLLGLRALGG